METHSELPVRKFTVCTTFNNNGYKQYGRKMIETFILNWPTEVDLYVYAEDCSVDISAPNVYIFDSHKVNSDLVSFKNKWRSVPKANGDVSSITSLCDRKDSHKSFKWDAIRFSNKVYSVVLCSKTIDANALLWMDADVVCHSRITVDDLERLCPSTVDIAFLGRERKFSECGLYYINLDSELAHSFLNRFQYFYDNAETGIFTLSEWHDSFIFDHVRHQFPLKELNWSKGLIKGEGHPLINCEWGKYLDHLKGKRKESGKSFIKDLIITRTEQYWKSI